MSNDNYAGDKYITDKFKLYKHIAATFKVVNTTIKAIDTAYLYKVYFIDGNTWRID